MLMTLAGPTDHRTADEVTGSARENCLGSKPGLFMTVRREIAQPRRETGARRREGGRRIPWNTLTD